MGCCRACTQALLDVLVPEEDLRMYTQIEERIRESEQRRFQQLEEAQSQVKGVCEGGRRMKKTEDADCNPHRPVLSQTLAQLRSTSTRDAANWKPDSVHLDDMEKLQSEHFDLVKRINDDEARLRSVEMEMEQIAKDIDGIDHVDVESQEEMDKDAIAVGLFRKMGFVPCYLKSDSQEPSAVFESLMVRSETKNRSTELEVNDDMMKAKSITPYILANQLWLASE